MPAIDVAGVVEVAVDIGVGVALPRVVTSAAARATSGAGRSPPGAAAATPRPTVGGSARRTAPGADGAHRSGTPTDVADQLVGDLRQEPAGDGLAGRAEQRAAPGVAEVEARPGAGDADVAEPAFLLQLAGVVERPGVGEHPVLHADHEHHRELQALGRVHRHERDPPALGVEVVRVGDERHRRQVLVQAGVPARRPGQLQQVLGTTSGLDAVLGLQLRRVAGAFDHGGDEVTGAGPGCHHLPQVHQQRPELLRSPGCWPGQPGVGSMGEGAGEGPALDPGPRPQAVDRRGAQPAPRHVGDAPGGDLVGRVGHHAQVGEDVLHFAAVVEAGAADHAVRHLGPDQGLFEGPALRIGAEEDGDVAVADALDPPQPADLGSQPGGLVVLVLGPVAAQLLADVAVGPQRLRHPGGVVGDDGVGGVQDGAGGTVVLLERHDRGAGKGVLELDDVGDVGAAPAVDGLVEVAHRAHLVVLTGDHHHQVVLGAVGVLVLVDQDVAEPAAVALQHVGEAAEQVDGDHQQVVEVHGRGSQQALLVSGVHLGDAPVEDGDGARRERLEVDKVGLGRRDGTLHGAGRDLLGVDPQLLLHLLHQPAAVGVVVDGERAAVPEPPGVSPEDPDAGRVERGHPHGLRRRADQLGQPVLHLRGSLVGEGDGQDLVGCGIPGGDQVGDAPSEHPGLARAGAGDHQQRAATVCHRPPLGLVQPLQEDCGVAERVAWRRGRTVRRPGRGAEANGPVSTCSGTGAPARVRSVGEECHRLHRSGGASRHCVAWDGGARAVHVSVGPHLPAGCVTARVVLSRSR